ncbi:AAA family ATPase [Campylobacter suis]|uniref:Ribose 1,5-bisphosphate phosphokinase PhnN n=1 Tax=Campylobacter suis TaxID=2790657 RepID=A0ABM8Q955_9BACT|nr:AAA family ATPase [Campylobacter suis]CAD7289338.1 Ribose 1,5-bisphosphate phosphokinase PhnN [Campylobacter suis]
MKIILIVGASGVGKDSLIKGAKVLLSGYDDISFTRRYITRKPDKNEDNIFATHEEMKELIRANFFISHWSAHENIYAIAQSFLVQNTNIISVSRGAIKDFEDRFENVFTIHIKASDEVLLERLLGRGRESKEQIISRIKRSKKEVVAKRIIEFENVGNLNENIIKFTEILKAIHAA